MVRQLKIRRLLFWGGVALVSAGLWQLAAPATDTYVNASFPSNTTEYTEKQSANYIGWGTLALGFLALASSHYFKLRDARRLDRAERREVARDRRVTDDKD